ncbi:MAG: anti-sigma factor [Pseudolabrys sp.]|nr:anti-sigma factor [Pseudolabrys sp.]
MSDTFDHSQLPQDDALAAEFVLGLLSQADRQAAERRIAREPAFAGLVAHWEAQLVPFADDIAPVQPPHDVWLRISTALPPEKVQASRWASLAFWRGFAIGASGLALASLVALFVVPNAPSQKPLVATITGGNTTLVATIDPRTNNIVVVPAALNIPADKVPELWLIPADGKPRSLGILRRDQAVTLVLPPGLATQATAAAVLAVSVEPPGGSPTGLPTGPVIGQGKLTNL